MLSKMRNEFIKKELAVVVPVLLIQLIVEILHAGPLSYVLFSNSYSSAIYDLFYEMPMFCTIAIVVVTIFYIYKGLFSNEAFTAFSLPYKKSDILFARVMPTILIGCIGYGLSDFMNYSYHFLSELLHGNHLHSTYPLMGGLFNPPYVLGFIIENTSSTLLNTASGVLCLNCLLLAYVVGKSSRSNKFWRGFAITAIISICAFADLMFVLYDRIANKLTNELLILVTQSEVQYENWYATYGFKAIAPDLLYYAAIVFTIVFSIVICIVTKKIANKKMSII